MQEVSMETQQQTIPPVQENTVVEAGTQTNLNSDKPKSNGFLITLLSILLLISCIIAGFFAYQTQSLVKELTEIKNTTGPTPTVSPSEMPVATGSGVVTGTEDWKTYTNSEYSFTFNYPSNWTVESNSSDVVLVSYSLPTKQRFFVTYHISYSINEWLDDTQSGKIIGKKQVGDNVFTQVEGGLALDSLEYLLENRGKGFVRFIIEPSNNKIESEETFNQILSTFKFTN